MNILNLLFKFSLTLLFFFAIQISWAQKKLPVIKAGSQNALIIEGIDEKTNWYLSPETKPDVHTITKSPKPKWVKFYTDIDSIKVKLKPEQHFDFIVLLNGKDSCYTRLQSLGIKNYSRLQSELHDTIPFVLTEFNNIKLKVTLNQKDTLNLKFDSGTSDFLLTREVIKNKLGLKNLSNHTFKIGSQIWDKQIIYPVELSGQGTDGRFGWNLFDGKIVEIDYDKKLFIVHSRLSKPGKDYQKLEMSYLLSLFYINGELQIKNKKYGGLFLFDSGYQRTIMLDAELVKEQNYPKDSLTLIKKTIMHNGQGKEVPVLILNNEKLNIGKCILKDIPVQLMTGSNPSGYKSHILGNEVLKRFNTILNFQNNVVYLKPNGLFYLPYTEATKSGA